jgi:hypothetical protein
LGHHLKYTQRKKVIGAKHRRWPRRRPEHSLSSVETLGERQRAAFDELDGVIGQAGRRRPRSQGVSNAH